MDYDSCFATNRTEIIRFLSFIKYVYVCSYFLVIARPLSLVNFSMGIYLVEQRNAGHHSVRGGKAWDNGRPIQLLYAPDGRNCS